jgi:hypothetical protein
MMDRLKGNYDEDLVNALKQIQAVPARNPHKAAATRARYLSSLHLFSTENRSASPVSGAFPFRLNQWIENTFSGLKRKERFSMVSTIGTIFVIASLLFGGAGVTVFAAQDDLPGDLLYSVKTLGEDVELGLAATQQSQLKFSLAFSNRRIKEMAALVENQQPVPEEVAARWQAQMNVAFSLAAGIENAQEMNGVLEQIREQIQQQEQVMAGLSENQILANPVIARVREMLREKSQLCELGLQNQEMFKYQIQHGADKENILPAIPPSPGAQSGSGINTTPGSNTGTIISPAAGGCTNCSPVQSSPGAGPGQNLNPGYCIGSDCSPNQDGTGPGPGPNAGPGSDNGPGDCTNCDPNQDGTGPGPGPNTEPGTSPNPDPEPGSGDNGGNPSGDPKSNGQTGGGGGRP